MKVLNENPITKSGGNEYEGNEKDSLFSAMHLFDLRINLYCFRRRCDGSAHTCHGE